MSPVERAGGIKIEAELLGRFYVKRGVKLKKGKDVHW